ncbi:MFS transporter [Paracoccus litorisediminis]|uniref:MFS transporter n=1 Tax=Paracoccus litorisediminis TaxID=2006130 RepID=UPI0014786422|nr:MFS transporter [Paracoccus litorisediminis]
MARPLLVSALIGQVVAPLVRIATSYRATDLDLSPQQVLLLSSAFSVLPMFLAVRMGRYNDLHGNGHAAIIGSALVLCACLMLVWPGGNLLWLVAVSIVLGLGQTFQLTGLQGEIGMLRLPSQRSSMVGSLMFWQAVGQVAAPLLLSLVAIGLGRDALGLLSLRLALVASALAAFGLGLGLLIWRNAAPPRVIGMDAARMRRIIAVPGFLWVIVAGSLCVAVHDLVLVFMPVLGVARGIAATEVGVLLAMFAIGQMISRACYRRVVLWWGPRRLMYGAVLATALASSALALPLGTVATGAALGLTGLSMGFAITSSVSLTMDLAPRGARATSLGLRLALNRAGQFLIPLASGGAAAALGPGAVFALLGAILCGVGLSGSRQMLRKC